MPQRAAALRSTAKFRLGWPTMRKMPRSAMPFTVAICDWIVFGFALKRAQVIAVELDGEFAFHAGDSLFHVVGDGLRVVPDDAGKLLQAPCRWRRSAPPYPGGRQGRHSSFGLRSTKYSVLKKPAVSVPSSGRPVWLTTCVTSGNEAMTRRALLVKSTLAVGPSLGGSVPRTQIEPSSRCGQKLRSDRTAEG